MGYVRLTARPNYTAAHEDVIKAAKADPYKRKVVIVDDDELADTSWSEWYVAAQRRRVRHPVK